jgi:hypothetical protein
MTLSQRPWGPSNGNTTGLNINALNSTNSPTPAPLPAVQTVTVTTETLITNPAQANNVSPPQNSALIISVPPDVALSGIPFELWLSGKVKTGTTSNVTAKIYGGNALTGVPATDSASQVATSGAVSVASTTEPFWLKINAVFDLVSGKMRGNFSGQVGNTPVAQTTLTNSPTGISDSDPVVSFYPTITFGTANAGNSVEVDNFSVG